MDIYYIQYNILKFRAYEIYKREWCSSRGYNITDRDRFNGFNGEDYVCLNEFAECEFQNEDYIQTLLSENDFKIYKKIMSYIKEKRFLLKCSKG